MNNNPKHIAIIMDGNGRWARKRGLPKIAGHKKGVDAIRGVMEKCVDLGVPYLTLYAFSSENWKRPQKEVDALMNLLRDYLRKETERFVKEGIRLRAIGDLGKLPDDIQQSLAESIHKTKDNEKINLTIALSYGGRDEIVRAVGRMERAGDTVSEEEFAQHLDTADLPELDLLIRTGGEQRISNFLLWQMAYTELYFTDTLWSDFGENDLTKAVAEFKNRERKFGK